MVDPISVDLRQQNSIHFEVKDGSYFLDGHEVSAEKAITSLVISLQTLGNMVRYQESIACGNGYADSRLIEWLLNKSGVTCYQISKKSDVSESTLSRITSGETSLPAIRFGTAIKLSEYAKKLQVQRMGSGKVKFEKGSEPK
ncbi:helix-turn-helix domain-containing protein [Paenibacillus gallinarum]|uniref:HTH cro/C1-type domain-containing protein n=1 Tax=Paenibacillus gallinarum TaxID=2762232 RepID=A0ABR8T3F4_9BACL|nr:helix-turn-helix domain-containing protein [Paenibacillus gallinarum]MBD7970283.1 hypothetical protein [Paenibacillus gallinarum]